MPVDDSVILQRDGAVATVILNRPDKLNSFTTGMTSALSEVFTALERDSSCRAILLTGQGRGFCAGQDLSDTLASGNAGDVDLGETVGRYYNPLVRQMRALPKPIVCAVNGVAAGAISPPKLVGATINRSCCTSVRNRANVAPRSIASTS